jgi:hypothetical protein
MTEANPEDINFTTYRVFDSANTFNADLTNKFADGNVSINQSVKHYYGRTHASRQRYEVTNDGEPHNANIYFESYCFGTTGGNACDKSLLPQGLNSARTDDIRWFINASHTANEGNAGTVTQRGANDINATTPTNTAPSVTALRYDASQGYPYRGTMQNSASRWLIYNENDPTSTRNFFAVEFDKAGAGWSGAHDTNASTDDAPTVKTNRRSMW